MTAASLRGRLTALAAGAAAAALTVTGAVLVSQLRSGLVHAVDVSATGRAREVAALWSAGRSAALDELPRTSEVVVQVVGPTGVVVAASDGAAGRARLFGFPAGGAPRTVRQVPTRSDRIDYRVAAVPAGDAVVYAGAPVDDVQDGVTLLAARLALAGPALLAVLVAGVWLLVGRALAPVEVLRRQAESIGGTDLTRRVALPAPAELSRLAVTLNDLLSRVQRAAGQQRRFLDDAAHELRNPVAAMLAALEVHARTSDDPDAAALVRQAGGLSELVTDLLALARWEAGAGPARTPVDLAVLVRQQLRDRPGVRAELAPAWVLADPGSLGRAVGNLLDNAQRHAARQVDVRLARDGATAVLAVRDDGPGVAVQDRDRVFDRFSRLDDARPRSRGGAGLGLAITRSAVTAAGGSVHVADTLHGATFVVRLPLLDRVAAGGAGRSGTVSAESTSDGSADGT